MEETIFSAWNLHWPLVTTYQTTLIDTLEGVLLVTTMRNSKSQYNLTARKSFLYQPVWSFIDIYLVRRRFLFRSLGCHSYVPSCCFELPPNTSTVRPLCLWTSTLHSSFINTGLTWRHHDVTHTIWTAIGSFYKNCSFCRWLVCRFPAVKMCSRSKCDTRTQEGCTQIRSLFL